MQPTILELHLYDLSDGTSGVEVSLIVAEHAPRTLLVHAAPLGLDLQALHTLEAQPEAYGRNLSQQFFAHPQLRAAWQQARSHLATGPLTVAMRLATTDPALLNVHWDRLRDPEDDQPLDQHQRITFTWSLEQQPLPRSPLAYWVGNPFTSGSVCPPERFIGREREVTALVDRLQTLQSCALDGEARIGKTSLLSFVQAHLPQWLAPYGRYHAILLNLAALDDPAHFRATLLKGLLPRLPAGVAPEQTLRNLEQALVRGERPSVEQTEQVIDWACQAELRIVLLLDEFREMLNRPEHFDRTFTAWLRSNYSQRRFAIIVVTRQPLKTIPELKGFYDTNAVTYTCSLGRFSAIEAKALVTQPHDRAFSPDEVQLALQVGDRHPLRLQIAADHLYNAKRRLLFSSLHTPKGKLRWNARRSLKRTVNQAYATAMYSSSSPHKHAPRRGLAWLAAQIGAAAMSTGEKVDQGQKALLGFAAIIGFCLLLVVLLARILGLIDAQTFVELLQSWIGN